MRAFFVRPFGTKEGIDFDQVEAALIRPALERLRNQYGVDIDGGTTGEFIRQGNIREEMFRLLVTADLVVADVSICNANALYELGIRHGLRHQHTFLMRAKSTEAKYPFELQTDRYFTYDPADLAGSVDGLAAALRSTLAADSKFRDSPVFQLLPNLQPHERAVLMTVPLEFREAVRLAQSGGKRGDLRLLANEAQGFEWESEGLRLVGDTQFKLKAFPGAKETFEALRKADPGDVHANLRLGTIYQELAAKATAADREDLLTRSDQAIRRALEGASAPAERAEAFSLLGSNAKTRWLADWRDPAAAARGSAALGSPHLANSLDSYLSAYAENLASYYPGGNALALLKIQGFLAQQEPDTWEAAFDNSDRAGNALADRDACAQRIAAALNLVLGIDPVLNVKQDKDDAWAALTRADILFLTSDKTKRIENEYVKALARVSDDPFSIFAVRRNIEIFELLGMFPENVKTALGVIDKALATAGEMPAAQQRMARVVLFTGHMVDRPDRPPEKMRFPRTAKAEAQARAMIEQALRDEMAAQGGVSIGIAGGACGADILFHEVCAALGIPTQLYLVLPQNQFQAGSVQHGGPDWVERYRLLCERVPPRVLQDDKALPRWLADKPGCDIWERNNLWMMFNALALDAQHLTLIALFNREREADGPGGTAHLVETTQKWGFKTIELDGRKLLEE
jgi:tetratricopeptide (TPR) repeat protein